jgi:hypothetical protein
MFNLPRHRIGCFYCSEFVYEFCRNYGINLGISGKVVKPMDMLNIPNGRIIFEGYLNVYTRIKKRQNHKKMQENKTV